MACQLAGLAAWLAGFSFDLAETHQDVLLQALAKQLVEYVQASGPQFILRLPDASGALTLTAVDMAAIRAGVDPRARKIVGNLDIALQIYGTHVRLTVPSEALTQSTLFDIAHFVTPGATDGLARAKGLGYVQAVAVHPYATFDENPRNRPLLATLGLIRGVHGVFNLPLTGDDVGALSATARKAYFPYQSWTEGRRHRYADLYRVASQMQGWVMSTIATA